MTALAHFAVSHPLLTIAWLWLLAGVAFSAFERRNGMEKR